MQASPTACLIIIGNEILSGRTQDKNLAWIAKELNEIGIRLTEVRVIPDIEATIIDTVNHCRSRFGYIFTTGGIGPTHDDITTECIAKAFGVAVIRHPEAERRLLNYYKPEQINPARMKMADIPNGAELIDNPVSIAPGFIMENVFVMAGVPNIMQAMFAGIRHRLKGGASMQSKTVSAFITEGSIAGPLGEIQTQHTDVEIGSYPFIRDGRLGTSLVSRSSDADSLNQAHEKIRQLLLGLTSEIADE